MKELSLLVPIGLPILIAYILLLISFLERRAGKKFIFGLSLSDACIMPFYNNIISRMVSGINKIKIHLTSILLILSLINPVGGMAEEYMTRKEAEYKVQGLLMDGKYNPEAICKIIKKMGFGGSYYIIDDILVDAGKNNNKEAIDALVRALGDRDNYVRRRATEALGKIGDKRAVEPLIKVLEDKYVKDIDIIIFRQGVAEALGKIGDKRAVEPLLKALGDRDNYVRRGAAEALGKIGNKRAVEPLVKALSDDDEYVRRLAAEALEDRIPLTNFQKLKIYLLEKKQLLGIMVFFLGAISVLIIAIKLYKSQPKRRWVANPNYEEDLLMVSDSSLKRLRAGHYEYDYSDSSYSYNRKVNKIKLKKARQSIKLLKHNNRNVREETVEVLVKMGEPAVKPLIKALGSKNRNIRDGAAKALSKIDDPRARNALKEHGYSDKGIPAGT